MKKYIYEELQALQENIKVAKKLNSKILSFLEESRDILISSKDEILQNNVISHLIHAYIYLGSVNTNKRIKNV